VIDNALYAFLFTVPVTPQAAPLKAMIIPQRLALLVVEKITEVEDVSPGAAIL
jgi:hypothetical protein